MGAQRARLLHRLGHADALRRHRRLADRRLPGDDADDRRVGPDLPVHHRHAARPRARARRATTARSPRTCTPTRRTRRAPTRSSRRRRRAACRWSPPQQMLDLARRPQRLDVRRDLAGAATASRFRVGVGAGRDGPARRWCRPRSAARRSRRSPATAAPVTFTRETIKGVEYAFFAASAGQYAASYEADTTAPAITNVAATAATDGSATVTWTTDEAADSRVDYGTAAGSLTQNATDAQRGDRAQRPADRADRRARPTSSASARPTAPATRPRRPPAPGLVQDATCQTPAAVAIETGTLRAGPASRLAARRQRALPGQLDDGRPPHVVLVRQLHGRDGRVEQPQGHLRGPQLPLVHADAVGVALERQHVAAVRLARRSPPPT